MWGNDTDNIIKEFFESSDDNYQKQEQIMRLGSGFNFDSLELMDYKLHKVSLKRGGSYIKSPEWLMHKRATINPKNKKVDKCFQKAWEVFKIKSLVSIMTCMFNVIHYCLQMCLKTLEMCVLKYMNLILFIFCLHRD